MKRIFVGSSSSDKALAAHVATQLTKLTTDGVQGECWAEAFPLGLLTFEALERMLRRCVAAVFIVSPDKTGHPNENVMIELGLVAGRMGRARVALCVCGDVTLPSDLLAVTRIDMDRNRPTKDDAAIERLTGWAKTIPAILNSVSCTDVLHGYSGRWRVVLNFEKWRTMTVTCGSIAALNADLLLQIPTYGHNGSGLLVGKLILHWEHFDSNRPEHAYSGSFNVSASVSDVTCDADGGMTFRTQTLSRQVVVQQGIVPLKESLPEELAAPWLFSWRLRPRDNSDPPLMDVTFETDVRTDWSAGTGAAYKEVVGGLW
jgi:hypothetical protein